MKDLSELYEENEYGYLDTKEGQYSGGYDTLIDSMGYEVLATKSFGSYQGDSIWVLRDGDRYGVLLFGYGSCSGCDAYEANNANIEDLTDLRDGMADSIEWYSKEDFVKRLSKTKEELVDEGVIAAWSYWEDGIEEFLQEQAAEVARS